MADILPLNSLHPLLRESVVFLMRNHEGTQIERIHRFGVPTKYRMFKRDGSTVPCFFPEPKGGGIGEFYVGEVPPCICCSLGPC